MALLTWNRACSVGVRAMDYQHGLLMDAINELCLMLERNPGNGARFEGIQGSFYFRPKDEDLSLGIPGPGWKPLGKRAPAYASAVARGCGREKACEMLDEMIELMRMHFSSEEQLMKQTGFAELEQHRVEHQRMLAQMLHAAHRLQYGERFELRPLLQVLHEEFLAHIEGFDQRYGPWLNDRGMS